MRHNIDRFLQIRRHSCATTEITLRQLPAVLEELVPPVATSLRDVHQRPAVLLEEILGKSKSNIIAIARVSLQVNQTYCDLLIETGD